MKSQPRALFLLNFVSMWEYFSYYGMRILLVLFLVHEFHYSDKQAFFIYTLYITLAELGGLAGGLVADRFLGLKRTILIGGWIIFAGHVSLFISSSEPFFFFGLGLIVIGTGLFRTNIPALLGSFYEASDSRREAGFTLYYSGINVGGFLATVLCGIVGEVYGWHAGFGLAALGMFLGNLALLCGRGLLQIQQKGQAVIQQPIIKNDTAWIKQLVPYLLPLILFYGCEEQLGSTLVLFSERHVDRQTLFGMFPASSLTLFNPLTILLMGPLLSCFLRKIPLSGNQKITLSFALLALAFAILRGGCYFAGHEDTISLGYAIGCIVMIALGEMLIGPTVYSAASRLAPPSMAGVGMGFVTIGFSLANLLSGLLSHTMAIEEGMKSIDVYSEGFTSIILASLACIFILVVVQKKRGVFVS